MDTLSVNSSAFSHQQEIPEVCSCEGKSASPPLSWAGVPSGTKSLALIVDDPDAPRGTFTHWVLYDLPPDVDGLPSNVSPKNLPQGAKLGRNSADEDAYYPMCPPDGRHRYFFKVFALDSTFEDLRHPTADELTFAMEGHILAQGELIGTYAKHRPH